MSTVEAVRRPAAVSTRFLRSELAMIFRRRRNQAILAVLAGIPIVIAIAIKVTAPVNDGRDGPHPLDRDHPPGGGLPHRR